MKWWRNSYTISALCVFWGLTAFWGLAQMRGYRQADILLQNKYNRAFIESAQRTKNVEVLLSKGMVSSSPEQMNSLFSDMWFNANAAQDNLHQLPISHRVVAQTSKFLTQVGDYAYSLTKRDQSKPLSDKDWNTMKQLYGKATSLNSQMATVQREAATGRFHWTEVTSGLGSQLQTGSISSADRSFSRIDNQLQEVPSLVYDGPFSDHLDRVNPLGLTGANVTAVQAREIARRFVDWKGSIPSQVRMSGNIKGKVPAYGVEFVMGSKPWQLITVNVSKKGGHVVYLVNPRAVDRIRLTDAQGRTAAQAYLDSHGLSSMISTYTLREQNVLTIAFAYKQGDVVIYPDQVKVQVALDNGQILGIECLGFLTSHHTRTLPEPKLTMAQARAKINSKLKLETERMAVVPTAGLHEVLAYEFKASLGSDTFLVYINALTGHEEHILKLIKLPTGTLSM